MSIIINGVKVSGRGKDGVGIPAGGASGQVLTKRNNTDYDTEWADQLSIDSTLSIEGCAADAKVVGSQFDVLNSLVGDTAVSEQISNAIDEATADDFGIYVQAQEPADAVAGDIWIDTVNDPSYIPPALPEITEADNGKVLMVVNGKLQLVNLNLSVDANGVLSV